MEPTGRYGQLLEMYIIFQITDQSGSEGGSEAPAEVAGDALLRRDCRRRR